MKPELTLDALPKPGEPLQPDIHRDNRRLLQEDVRERIERQKNRLTRKERFILQIRWRWLRYQLIRSEYNPLIVQRQKLWEEYEALKYQLIERKSKKIYVRFQAVKQAGIKINKRIRALDQLSSEFDRVNNKLKAHDELLKFEREDQENFEAFVREARTWEKQLYAAFRQSPRLHHKSENSKGETYIDIPIIREIIVKDDRVMYHVKTTGQSFLERLLSRWHSALPYGVDVSALVSDETLKNLSTMCNRVVTVQRSQRGTNLFYVISRLDSPDGIPSKLLYQKILDFYPIVDHKKSVWCAGVTNDRQLQWFNFEDTPHILIAGATLGGKSNHINQMIATLVTMHQPKELRVLLVDLKGGVEFTHWNGLQHQIRDMLKTPKAVLEGLQWLRSIMENRLIAFEKMKAKNLTSYNEKVKEPLPRLICFVDEMATLLGLGQMTTDIHTELRTLSSQGRAVGIHLVLCTQHSSVDVLPGWVKTNMMMRISAKMPSHQASMVILDSITAATLPDVPGRMVFSIGRSEVIAQSPFISDDQIAEAIRLANSFPAGDDIEFIDSLPDPQESFSSQDVIKLALEMNGKLSANRIYDLIGDEVNITLRQLRAIVDRIKDDLEKGPIEHEGTYYNMTRKGRAYVLIPMEQDHEIEMEQGMEHKKGKDMVAS